MGKAERKLQRNREYRAPEGELGDEEEEEEDVMQQVKDLMRLVGPMLAIGLLVVLGVFFINKLRDSKATSVERVSTEMRGVSDPAELVKLVDANPDTPEAANQLMRSAKLEYSAGKFAEAAAAYERVAKEYPNYPMAAAASLNIATCLENQGSIDEAKAAYEAWIDKNADHFRKPIAELGVARCLLQTSPPQATEAKKLFEDFLAEDPEGPFAAKVKSYIQDAERLIRQGS